MGSMAGTGWQQLGAVALAPLVDARLQAHWAMQLVGAAADATVARAHDDSQSNAAWRADLEAWQGKSRAGLRPADLALLLFDASRTSVIDELPLDGRRLADALAWLGDRLGAALAVRDYDMPAHGVSRGEPFALRDGEAFRELARWYHDGELALRPHAAGFELATWPHHFDIGALVLLERDRDIEHARSIGIGLSPGDKYHPEPYWYVTPYPIPAAAPPPALPLGRWQTTGFTGAVLVASELIGAADQHADVDRFLRAAIEAGRAMITA